MGEAKLRVDVELAFDASIGGCCCRAKLATGWLLAELRKESGQCQLAGWPLGGIGGERSEA